MKNNRLLRFIGVALQPLALAVMIVLGGMIIVLAVNGMASADHPGVILSGGKLTAIFADPGTGYNSTDYDRLDSLVWTNSGGVAGSNLVAEGGAAGCNDPSEYFGESYGVPENTSPVIVIGGLNSTASNVSSTTLTSTTSGLDCNGNNIADATAITRYQVFPAGDPDENELRFSRTINFTSTPNIFSFTAVTGAAPSSTQTSNAITVSTAAAKIFSGHGVHSYTPRLPLSTYSTVLIPNAAGTAVNTYSAFSCGNDCEETDWNGIWFADDNGSGSGMVVFRDASSTAPAEISINNDSSSSSNLTSIVLLQPVNGWQVPVTETEWLCFYDPTSWPAAAQSAGKLPQGCAQSFPAGSPPASVEIPISITGGSYSVNGGAYTSAAGQVKVGDLITVRLAASAGYSTLTAATLTINGVSGNFDVTTEDVPAPTVSLAASRASITLGQSSTLTWSSTNATSCTASGAWSGSEAVSGMLAVTPVATGSSSYTLSCTGTGGTTASTATVNVTAVPTVAISASPTSVTLGHSSTLTWSSSNAASCAASGAWSGSEATSGTLAVTPAVSGSNTYTLTCTDANNVAVSASASVTATPLPTVSIAASPSSLILGSSATLTWSSSNATSCTASGAWSGSEATSGTQSVTPGATGISSYTLTCTGTGGNAAGTASVTVTAPVPTVMIAISPTAISIGQSATLSWSSTNATSCTASGAWSGSEATSGSSSQSPDAVGSDTYTLSCTGSGGTVTGSATLSVAAAPPPPAAPTVIIAANPAAITLGQSSTLTWSSTNATTCSASGAWSGDQETAGSAAETPAAAGAQVYTLSCSGPGGNVVSAASVTVSAPVVITSLSGKAGGGGFGFGSLFGLGLLALLRQRRALRGLRYFLLLFCMPAFAQDARDTQGLHFNIGSAYAGVRGGVGTYSTNSAAVNSAVSGDAATVSSIDHHKGVGVLYAGVPFYNGLAVELGYADLGVYHLNLSTTSANVSQVAADAIGKLKPAGRGLTLGLGGPFDIGRWVAVEPHFGALIYQSRQEIFTPAGTYSKGDIGLGLDAGVALLLHPFRPLYFGAGFECFDTSGGCNVQMKSLELEYHFGR